MSNKIIQSLISGNQKANPSIAFDTKVSHYFTVYANGVVGCYSQGPRMSFAGYVEYSMVDDKLVQAVNGARNNFVGPSLGSFFKSIIETNHHLMLASKAKSEEDATLHPYAIVAVYWYNPVLGAIVEEAKMAIHAVTAELKSKLENTEAFFKSVINNKDAQSGINSLIIQVRKFITNLIKEKQRASKIQWTADGMLPLNLQEALDNNKDIQSAHEKLVADLKAMTYPSIPSLDKIVQDSFADTNWVLGRAVDFTVSPFVYLYPRGPNMPAILPAVPVTDRSLLIEPTPSTPAPVVVSTPAVTEPAPVVEPVAAPVVVESTPEPAPVVAETVEVTTAETTATTESEPVSDPATETTETTPAAEPAHEETAPESTPEPATEPVVDHTAEETEPK